MNGPPTRPVSLLIAALGGEGGGVLTGWIVAAAHAAGLAVQATSIPGVAQRTGATTYYIEIWPQPIAGPIAGPDSAKRPVMALSPAPGEVDVVATTELLEAARCIQSGLVTPDRTHLIASTHRTYTTIEKMAAGDGRYDHETLLRAAESRSAGASLLDLDALAEASGARINAVLLGVLAASGKLPVSSDALRAAIAAGERAVAANLRGFDAGLAAAGTLRGRIDQDAPGVHALIDTALARLRGYQSERYAELFLKRIEPFRNDAALLLEVVRGLARHMAFNDIIRVAQLKTRPGRLAALTGAPEGGEVVQVREYFRPGLSEVADILPAPLGRALARWVAAKPGRARLAWPLVVRSTTVTGQLALRLLAALRPLRRLSHRYRVEQAAIKAWLADIESAMAVDPALAIEIAKNARLLKGYGDTLSRSRAAFETLRHDLVQPALDGTGPGAGTGAERVAAARRRALADTAS